MEYKFSGQANYDDYLKYKKALLVKSLSKERIILYCQILLYLILVIISIYKRGIILTFLQYIELHIIFFIVLIPIVILNIDKIKSKFKKAKTDEKEFKTDKNRIFTEKCFYIINENQIIINYKNGKIALSKENIRKILFDNDSIYILPKKNPYKIIKKRFFEDEKTFDELVLFLKEYYL